MSDTSPPTESGAEPTVESTAETGYRVRVGSFDGPLDLLLHLVRVNEVDVTDIPIVSITEQYHDYLALMQRMNLEVAGEYLVMAATLMHIKSQMLLPPDPDGTEEEADDPRAQLAQQLLEYQRFRQAAENLQAMESRRGLIWTRDDVPEEFADEELLTVDMFDLMQAFQKMLGRLGEEARLRLKRDTVSVAEKIDWLTGLLDKRRSLSLMSLLEDLPTRLDRIATFLAVLEMMRLAVIVVFQRKLFDEIRIARKPDGPASDGEPDH